MAKSVKYPFKPIMLILLPEHKISITVAVNRHGTSTEWFDIAFEIPELFIIGRK